LAFQGIIGAMLGWFLVHGRVLRLPRRPLQLYLNDGSAYAAAGGMLVGVAALLVFVASNASLDVVGSGEFRDTTIQTGTGKYFFLAYCLIAGSVLLACYLLRRGHPWLSFVPAGCCMILYGVLGGRARATIAVTGVLLVHWYFRRETRDWRKLSIKPVYLLTAPLAGLSIVWLSYIGSIYRGDLGARGLVEGLSLSGLWAYVQSSIFTDIGQLHGLAGAIAVGPAVLDGQTFFGSFAWPLTRFLPIPARSAGVFIVEMLAGFQPRTEKWGVNASLIGDAYVNFGLWGTAGVMLLYGALLKAAYLRFREGRLNLVIYVLVALYALQIFWVSIEVWPQALTVMGFTCFMMFLGDTVFRVKT
jgi:oligosaccharide repeat unit polymerase